MDSAEITVAPEDDQEDVARVSPSTTWRASPSSTTGAPVGRVTLTTVIDVVEAETTEDILQFGGTSADERLAEGWREAVRTGSPG